MAGLNRVDVVPRTVAELGEPFAIGASAELYAYGDALAVKLFREHVPDSAVAAESIRARAAMLAGLPTAAVGELIHIEDRAALIMERVHGPTLTSLAVSRQLSPEATGTILAELHAKVHTASGVGSARALPSLTAWLAQVVQRTQTLDERQRSALLSLLERLPDGVRMCHGDLHPDNVLVPTDGEPKLIDWAGATRGPALADVAETVLLMTTVPVPPHIASHEVIEELKHAVNDAYVKRYFELAPGSVEAMERWLPLNAAARLSFGIESERSALLAVVNRALS